MSKILVTGATGHTGGEILRRLSQRGIAARALVRDPNKLAPLPHVEVAVGDLARPGDALAGIDRAMLISSSVPEMQDVQTAFIAAAKAAGVGHIVKLSGIIPDVASPFRFARMHGEIERALADSGIAYTNLRAGELMHSYFRQVPSIVGKGALFLPMAGARIACIDTRDVAAVAIEVLLGGGHDGRSYPLTGPEALTMAEVAERLSRATGRPIRYVDVPPEDARRARLAAGMPAYNADALDELFAERRAGKEATVSPVIEAVFGLRGTTFEQFATRHAAIFRGDEAPPRV